MDPKVPVLLFEDVFADLSLFDTTTNATSLSISPGSSVSAPSPTPPLFSPRFVLGRKFGDRDGALRSPTSHASDDDKPVPLIDSTLVTPI